MRYWVRYIFVYALGLLACLGVLGFFLAELFDSSHVETVLICAAMVLVFALPLLHELSRSLSKWLGGVPPLDREQMRGDFAKQLLHIMELNQLIWLLVHTIPLQFHSRYSAVFLKEKGFYQIKGEDGIRGNMPSVFPEHHIFSQHLRLFGSLEFLSDLNKWWSRPSHRECYKLMSEYGLSMLIPFEVKGDIVGFWAIGSSISKVPFSRQDGLFFQTMANLAAVSLQKAWHNAQLRRSLQDVTYLNDFVSRVLHSLDAQYILSEVIEESENLFDVADSIVVFRDAAGQDLLINSVQIDGEALEFPITAYRRYCQSRSDFSQPCFLRDCEVAEVQVFFQQVQDNLGMKDAIFVPFVYGDDVLGYMVCLWDELHVRDYSVLHAFSQEVSLALHSARLFQNVRHLKEYNAEVLEQLPVGVLVVDEEDKVVISNQKFRELLGAEDVAVMQDDLGPLQTLFSENSVFEVAAREEEARLFELDLSQGAEALYCSVSVGTIRYQSRDAAVIILTNITHIRCLQDELEQANRLVALGTMAGGISSEMASPLADISQCIDLLQRDWKSEDHRAQFKDTVAANIDKINILCQSLLDLGRPKTPHLESIPISYLLDEVSALLQSDEEVNSAALHIKDKSDVAVLVDRGQLVFALMHVIRNGLDAVDENGVVEVFVLEETDAMVEVRVVDSGSGLSELEQNQVFDPFFTTKSENVGLGLTVAHRIVKEHKGTIHFSSESGLGTTVSLFLPTRERIERFEEQG